MVTRKVSKVWALDSRWNRVEYFDAAGRSLGMVRFEPNPLPMPPPPGGRYSLRAIVRTCAVLAIVAGMSTVASLLMAGR